MPIPNEPKPIDFPNVNGLCVCTCGSAHFQVGLEIDLEGDNEIRCIECVSCGAKHEVPYNFGIEGIGHG